MRALSLFVSWHMKINYVMLVYKNAMDTGTNNNEASGSGGGSMAWVSIAGVLVVVVLGVILAVRGSGDDDDDSSSSSNNSDSSIEPPVELCTAEDALPPYLICAQNNSGDVVLIPYEFRVATPEDAGDDATWDVDGCAVAPYSPDLVHRLKHIIDLRELGYYHIESAFCGYQQADRPDDLELRGGRGDLFYPDFAMVERASDGGNDAVMIVVEQIHLRRAALEWSLPDAFEVNDEGGVDGTTPVVYPSEYSLDYTEVIPNSKFQDAFVKAVGRISRTSQLCLFALKQGHFPPKEADLSYLKYGVSAYSEDSAMIEESNTDVRGFEDDSIQPRYMHLTLEILDGCAVNELPVTIVETVTVGRAYQ